MATKFVPSITEEDYESFRSLLHGSIPDSYYDWLNLAFEMKTESIGEGNYAAPVEVKPDEFARYCRTTESSQQSVQSQAVRSSERHGECILIGSPRRGDIQPPAAAARQRVEVLWLGPMRDIG